MIKLKFKSYKRFIVMLMTLCLLLDITGGIFKSKVKADSTWTIIDHYNNPYLIVDRVSPDKIILLGNHNKKTGNNYYKTEGFVLTSEPYFTSGSFPTSAKSNNVHVRKRDVSSSGSTVTTEYTINFKDIIRAAAKAGITGESIGNGTQSIYLHVIYDIYKGENRVVRNVIGVQEIMHQ